MMDQSNIIHSSILQAPIFQSKLHRYILLQHASWIKAILSIHPLFKHPFSNLNFIGTYCFNTPYGSKQQNPFIHFSRTHFSLRTLLNCLNIPYRSKKYNPFIHFSSTQFPIYSWLERERERWSISPKIKKNGQITWHQVY